jgi:hypothetical protein
LRSTAWCATTSAAARPTASHSPTTSRSGCAIPSPLCASMVRCCAACECRRCLRAVSSLCLRWTRFYAGLTRNSKDFRSLAMFLGKRGFRSVCLTSCAGWLFGLFGRWWWVLSLSSSPLSWCGFQIRVVVVSSVLSVLSVRVHKCELTRRRCCHSSVIAVDVAGRGNSDNLVDPSLYGYKQYAADAVRVLHSELGLTEVDWVGTSMGGLLAMVVASTPDCPLRYGNVHSVSVPLSVSHTHAHSAQASCLVLWAQSLCCCCNTVNFAVR